MFMSNLVITNMSNETFHSMLIHCLSWTPDLVHTPKMFIYFYRTSMKICGEVGLVIQRFGKIF